ncbi:MAG TPA: hypothetical protein VF816_14425 [Rhodocyclaceae bacterium]
MEGFAMLLYRYLFFDWLFADMGKARNVLERRDSWRHNQSMRRYLPTYLRRWSVLTGGAFVLGWIFEQLLRTRVLAACCFTGCAMTITGMALICVLWLMLARPEAP